MSGDRINTTQLRLVRVTEALAGHEFHGVRQKDLAQTVGVIPTTIYNDLLTLEEAGWATRSPADHDRWMLAARPIQVLHHFYSGLERIRQKVDELAANATRLPV